MIVAPKLLLMAKERKFTDDQRISAVNLGRVWNEKQRKRKFTQEDAADELSWTQGTIHQYVRGKIPLNNIAVLKFAQFLEIYPTEIDPHFLNKVLQPELADIINTYLKMHKKNRALWKQTGNALAQSSLDPTSDQ